MKTYEDVIEQLGGYDKAKEIVNQNIKDFEEAVDEVGTYHSSCGWVVHEDLVKYLLEYRRENKFFEEGDFVTYMWLDNKVDKYNPECIIKSPWRHSTDEEIEAYKHLN